MYKYTIRLANEKDIEGIARVSAACFPSDYKKGGSQKNDLSIAVDWMRKRFNLYPYSLFFVATPENKPKEIIGFGLYLLVGGLSGVVQLEILGVTEKHRKRGVASQLISESEPMIREHLKKNFNKSVYKYILTTSMENPSSHSVYKKQGYEMSGSLGLLYWGTEEVLYSKENKAS